MRQTTHSAIVRDNSRDNYPPESLFCFFILFFTSDAAYTVGEEWKTVEHWPNSSTGSFCPPEE